MPRALLSVYDKTGLVELAGRLIDLGWDLISTGGTFRAITDAGLPVQQVSAVTGSPEILDGRVKTLHPVIHGGLLARRDLPEHMTTLEEHNIAPIDLLVSNLYPFEATVADDSLSNDDIVEQIDIGGPAMLRAASKNFASVAVLTSPDDYAEAAERIGNGSDDIVWRRALAAKAFGHVSTYDSLVAEFLRDEKFPQELSIGLRQVSIPKYGENSHQEAAAYQRLRAGAPVSGILQAHQHKGDPLSFNNYLDADAAWNVSQQFDGPTVAIVKHTVPCGLAVRETLAEAWEDAFEGDTVSAFGGIVGLNRTVDLDTAKLMRKIKLDIIIAPGYEPDALELLQKKSGTRILELPNQTETETGALDVRVIRGGILIQDADAESGDTSSWQVVTKRAPADDVVQDLAFAWRTLPFIKSNAIVFVKNRSIVGLGAGQPNRMESVNLAARKAGENAVGAVMASDAFFPFADGLEIAIQAGVQAVVQPGGSLRDDEVIAAADNADISMMFTGKRHFRH